MATPRKSKTGQAGISNHPLEEERQRQKIVPPRGKAEEGPTRAGKRRALFEEDDQNSAFISKGAKGGKTGGSRAGLVAAGRKVGTTTRAKRVGK